MAVEFCPVYCKERPVLKHEPTLLVGSTRSDWLGRNGTVTRMFSSRVNREMMTEVDIVMNYRPQKGIVKQTELVRNAWVLKMKLYAGHGQQIRWLDILIQTPFSDSIYENYVRITKLSLMDLDLCEEIYRTQKRRGVTFPPAATTKNESIWMLVS